MDEEVCVYKFNMCMFKTQVLSYGFGSIKNKINKKVNTKKPLKTGPAMAGPDGQVATALLI